VRVLGYPHPFKAERLDRSRPAGQSIAAYLAELGLAPRWHGQVKAWLNDAPVAPEHWSRVRPKPGSTLAFRVVPRAPLIPAIIAVAAAVGGVAGAGALGITVAAGYSALTVALVTSAIGLAISAIGQLLMMALVPVRPPKLAAASGNNPAVVGGGRPEASPTFSLTAPRNDTRPWGPIPVILGTHRHTPPYGAPAYSEFLSNEQFIIALVVWGYGPLQIANLKLGDTPIAQFQDVQIETRQGFPDDAPRTLATAQVYEQSLNLPLLESAGFHVRTTTRDIDAFQLDFVLPQGLAQTAANGLLLWSSVNLQADYRAVGASDWIPLIVPGSETPIAGDGFALSEAWEGESGASDPGSRGSLVIYNPGTGLLELIEGDLKPVGAQEFPALPPGTHGVAKVVVTANNLSRIDQTEPDLSAALKGLVVTNPSALNILVEDGTYFSTPATFEAATHTAQRHTMGHVEVARGQYEVRVRRTTPDTEATAISDEVYWSTLRAFRNDPPISFGLPLAVTAIRIRATDQLSGSLDNLNGEVTSILPDWNGSAWVAQATQNPASIARAILQGPANPRPLSDSQLDLASFQTWHAYCAAQGFRFNMIRDFRTSVWDALLDACSAGRGTLTLTAEGTWAVLVDELQAGSPPVQHFTPRNSWGFTAEKPYRDVPHGWRIRYLDEANGWQQGEALVYRDGYSAANATLYEQLELPGLTDLETVTRHGRFHFAQLMLRPELYALHADLEHVFCRRGDRIRVNHDVPLWGIAAGRVLAIDGRELTLDEAVALQAGHTYEVRARRSDGSSNLYSVQTVAGESQTLTLLGSDSMPAVGDLVMVGETGQETVSLVVLRIEPGPDLTARLVCVDESPEIHTADTGAIATWEAQTTLPADITLLPPAPPLLSLRCGGGLAVLHALGIERRPLEILLQLREPHGVPVARYEIAYHTQRQLRWHALPHQPQPGELTRVLLHTLVNDVYQIRARTVSPWGLTSAWVTEACVIAPRTGILETVSPTSGPFDPQSAGWTQIGQAVLSTLAYRWFPPHEVSPYAAVAPAPPALSVSCGPSLAVLAAGAPERRPLRLTFTLTDPAGVPVERLEVQYHTQRALRWHALPRPALVVRPGETTITGDIPDTRVNDVYQIRARTVSPWGLVSPWVTHTCVIGPRTTIADETMATFGPFDPLAAGWSQVAAAVLGTFLARWFPPAVPPDD
jgi:hypothetical protein